MFGNLLLNEEYRQLGKPYVLGAAGPNAFDCSGLVEYCYTQVTGIGIPHATGAQWPFWVSHTSLARCFNRNQISGPNDLTAGTLIFKQYEGWHSLVGPHGHEMTYINPSTYLQAPRTGENVRLSQLDWNTVDPETGGWRFGRFVELCYPPGMTPAIPLEEDEDEMYEAYPNKPAYIPAMLTPTQKCYLDFSPQTNEPYQIRLSFRCDDGSRGAPNTVLTWDIEAELSRRMEVGAQWGIPYRGGVTVKLEVLAGTAVIATRHQT